jgi:hypothetical protein
MHTKKKAPLAERKASRAAVAKAKRLGVPVLKRASSASKWSDKKVKTPTGEKRIKAEKRIFKSKK